MNLWIDVLLLMGALFALCIAAGVGVGYLFHIVVGKLDRAGAIVVDGQIFNTDTDEWEDL